MSAITKLTDMDAGCYVESAWGQYASARAILVAAAMGYDDADAIALATRHLATYGGADMPALTDDEYDALRHACDDAESWLNANVAGDDYYFAWHDGELFYQSVDWHDEDGAP